MFMDKADLETLRLLYRVTLGGMGKKLEVRKHLRQFNGYAFEADSAECEKKKDVMLKLTVNELKMVCGLCDVERSGAKEEIVERLMKFLLEPKESGMKMPTKKKKKGKKAKRVRKAKSGEKKEETVEEEEGEGEEEEEDEEEGSGESGSEEEGEEEEKDESMEVEEEAEKSKSEKDEYNFDDEEKSEDEEEEEEKE